MMKVHPDSTRTPVQSQPPGATTPGTAEADAAPSDSVADAVHGFTCLTLGAPALFLALFTGDPKAIEVLDKACPAPKGKVGVRVGGK